MRSLISTLTLALCCASLGAQSLTPEVVATGGATFSNATLSLEWTLGEIMTETYPGSFVLTQGFHQPPGDLEPPVARCRTYVVAQIDAAGNLALDPQQLNDGSFDVQSPEEKLTFKLDFGNTVLDCNDLDQPPQPVTLIVRDGNGFLASCTSLVSVADTVRPTLNCRDIVVSLDTVTREASLGFLENPNFYAASDNCGNLSLEVALPTRGTTIDCNDLSTDNTVTVTVTAKDESGNMTGCTIMVFVDDPFDLCEAALPVTWLSFGAAAGAKQVVLQWETTLETENAGFHVERSREGRSWTVIGEVIARSTRDQAYLFPDVDPHPGDNYYRIRQTDFSGHLTYSHVERVVFQAAAEVNIYPNPANKLVYVVLPPDAQLLGVYTATGQKTGLSWSGEAIPLRLNVSGLSPGVYLVRGQLAGGKPFVRKLLLN